MMTVETLPEASERHEIYPGLTLEWHADKKIVAYRISLVSHTLIDTWAKLVVSIMEDWPADQPYLAMHDLSQPGVSLQYATLVNFDTVNIGVNASGRKAVESIMDSRVEFFGQVAVNFNLSVSGQVNRMLADRRIGTPFVKYRSFYHRDNALIWLRETIRPETDPSKMETLEHPKINLK